LPDLDAVAKSRLGSYFLAQGGFFAQGGARFIGLDRADHAGDRLPVLPREQRGALAAEMSVPPGAFRAFFGRLSPAEVLDSARGRKRGVLPVKERVLRDG
jgi:hypothetical protein